MPRKVERLEIAGFRWMPSSDEMGWVRTGDDTAVPQRFRAIITLSDPPMQVHLGVVVRDGGRAEVHELALVSSDGVTPIQSSTLRRIPVDALLRVALERTTHKVRPRSDVDPRAFEVPGHPALPGNPRSAWISSQPPSLGRGRNAAHDRVAQAAQIYLDALAAGSHSPAEVVAERLGYSRATAARDLREARRRIPPLLPPAGEPAITNYSVPGAHSIVGTGRRVSMPMSEFVSARTLIEEELGMRKREPEDSPDGSK
jgi:hypothetical protein